MVVSDFRVTVEVTNATGGDVDSLVEAIHEVATGFGVIVQVHQVIGGQLFGRAHGDDEIGV